MEKACFPIQAGYSLRTVSLTKICARTFFTLRVFREYESQYYVRHKDFQGLSYERTYTTILFLFLE